MSVNTFLIDDQRLAKSGNNKIIVGVKSGPASSVVQKYVANSNSVSNTLFNINIPSENVLVDRHILIDGTIQLKITVVPHNANPFRLDIVPAPFPFNQLLQSASMNINNSKVSVQTEDILNASLKQFEQKYLSKNCQGSANFVDKYHSRFSDNVDNTNANAFGDSSSAEKDSDTLGRGSNNLTMQLITAGVPGAILPGGHNVQVAGGAAPVEYLCTIHFVEPIFGLPTASLQENDGCYSGLTAIELSFQYTSFYKRAINYYFAHTGAVTVSAYQTDIVDAKAVLRYYSLHPSQYAKLSKKSVIPFDELVPYKTVEKFSTSILSNVLSLRQIPDKLYIFIRQKAADLLANWSNSLCFPITGVKINFNNVAGLLSEMSQNDLYLMSRRNGSQQVFNEFKGVIDGVPSIGSYVVIDVTRDLGLDDMLSASSLGQFSLQVSVDYATINGKAFVATDNVELVILANYSGILVTEQGSSSSMSGLLTKQSVIECKSKGSSNIDYDDVTAISGGNLFKQGKAEIGQLIKSERGRIASALDGRVDGSVDAVASKAKNLAHEKLSKYM